MPTGRELKRLLQPLLARRKDLALTGRVLFFSPVTHYLRGAFFHISRFSSALDTVTFVHQLCNGQASVDTRGNAGQRKYMMREDWETDLEKTSRELCERMENYALPRSSTSWTPCNTKHRPHTSVESSAISDHQNTSSRRRLVLALKAISMPRKE